MNEITLAAGEELNPLIPHPIEIVLSLVVFGLLYFAVKKWVVPNFEKTFAERTTAIEGGLKAAETNLDRLDDIDYVDLRFGKHVYVRPRAGSGRHTLVQGGPARRRSRPSGD